MHALLEMDCIPAGMELFPAGDNASWTVIERVITESDYYVVIIGGRYGSVSQDNPLSFTEREYDLAVDAGIPVLPFLHGDPGKIPQEKTDPKDEQRAALVRFRQKIESAHQVKYWTDPGELY